MSDLVAEGGVVESEGEGSGDDVADEGEPEGGESVGGREVGATEDEQSGGNEAGVAHFASAGGADEDAIELEGENGKGHIGGGEGEAGLGDRSDGGEIRHGGDDTGPGDDEGGGEKAGGRDGEHGGAGDGLVEESQIAATLGVADEGFGGKGEPVEEKGAESDQADEDVVGGQGGFAEGGALASEPRKPGQHGEGANHYVALSDEGAAQSRQAAELGPGDEGVRVAVVVAEQVPDNEHGVGGGDPLGDEGAEGNAAHAPVEDPGKEHIQRDVEPVEDELKHEELARAGEADEGAGNGEGDEGGGGGPDAQAEILAAEGGNLVGGGHEMETGEGEGDLEDDDAET